MGLKVRLGRFVVAFLLALWSSRLASSQITDRIPSQRELNGFLLGQQIEVLNSTLGKPTRVSTAEDGWVYRVYRLKQGRDSCMAFKSEATNKDAIYSIQIAGGKGTAMYPFLGLMLGDPKPRVLEALGKPSKVEHDAELNLDLYSYAPYNYSVEIDASGRLSSVQIFGYSGFPEKPERPVARLEPLQDAVTSGDIDKLISSLCPDVEIYQGAQTKGFATSARKDLSNPQSALYRLLCGKTGSLREVLETEHAKASPEMRIYEKSAPGCVYKFEDSRILKEIVFKYESGQWRVYEILFR